MSGRVALVTGAGARLGGALALELGHRGYGVAVHYGNNRAGAERIVAAIEVGGGSAIALQGDLLDASTPSRLRDAVANHFGRLDALVNNASYWASPEQISGKAGLLEESVEHWEHTLAINLRAPFFLMQACASMLEDADDGVIVNVFDRSISEPFLNRASHSIAKSALATATDIAAATLHGRVRVNGLECGDMLPPDAMPEAVRRTREWSGSASYVEAVVSILENRTMHGEVLSVG